MKSVVTFQENETFTPRAIPEWDGTAQVYSRTTEVRTPHKKDKEFKTKMIFNMIRIKFDPERDTKENLVALVEKEYQNPNAYIYVNDGTYTRADLELTKHLIGLQDIENILAEASKETTNETC